MQVRLHCLSLHAHEHLRTSHEIAMQPAGQDIAPAWSASLHCSRSTHNYPQCRQLQCSTVRRRDRPVARHQAALIWKHRLRQLTHGSLPMMTQPSDGRLLGFTVAELPGASSSIWYQSVHYQCCPRSREYDAHGLPRAARGAVTLCEPSGRRTCARRAVSSAPRRL